MTTLLQPEADPAREPREGPSDFWIARQPIFDRRRKLAGYELLYRGGTERLTAEISDGSIATAQVIGQGLLSGDLEKVSGGVPLLVNFTEELLVGDVGLTLDPHAFVIEVLESVPASSAVLAACRRLLAAGYRVALDDVVDPERVEAFARAASLVKVDWMAASADQIAAVVKASRRFQLQVLAEKLENERDLTQAEQLRCDYLQGFYLSKPESLRRSTLPSIEASQIRLLQAISQPELDLEEVTRALEADPSVSYRLLRAVNAAARGLNRRVSSIREAIVYLGHDELRRIATLVMLGSITGGAEQLLLSAVSNARGCDAIGAELGRHRTELFHFYMTGLLSGIDGLLGCSMEEALAPLPIAEQVSMALIEGQGPAADALELTTSYLIGDWCQVDCCSARLGIDPGRLGTVFRDVIATADSSMAA